MRNFPIQIVDNFFDDPDDVVQFANSLKYKKDPKGSFPGKRSDFLHTIDKTFFNTVLAKILALSFDYKFHKISWDSVQLNFQKTTPRDYKNKNNLINSGLIHQDGNLPLVGIVYLTKNADLNSGTSIFSQKTNQIPFSDIEAEKIKQNIYKKDFNKITKKELNKFEELINVNKNNYEETIRINNVYNRLIAYDGNDYHRANSFHTGEKERLTMVFFMKQISSNAFFPIQRMRNYQHSENNNENNRKRKSSKSRNN